MEISQEERSRIEAEADKKFPTTSPVASGKHFAFIDGAWYERTIANTQLSEKDRIIAEKEKEIERLFSLQESAIIEQSRKITSLQEALRIARETNWIEKK